MAGDIRVTVTKNILRNTLVSLMREKPFEMITVKDICALSGVSRSTFYAHYEDIYALLADYEKELFQSYHLEQVLDEKTESKASMCEMMVDILMKVEENKEFYRAYFRNVSSGYMEQALSQLSRRLVDAWMGQELFSDRSEAEYYFTFYKAGYFAIVREWLEKRQGERKTPEELADTLWLICSMHL